MLNARTGALRQHYLDAFERRNLVVGPQYDHKTAQARAVEMVTELTGSGRTVVLLGNSVREAFDRALDGKLPALLLHPSEVAGCTWRQIPHPSGRNLWYNIPNNQRVVELLMEELYEEYCTANQFA
jgi:hypothetical protein